MVSRGPFAGYCRSKIQPASGPSLHFRQQQLNRFRSEADIQRAALKALDCEYAS
jgi:hypothetical protein